MRIRRALIAPSDFAGERWDWDGDIIEWYEKYGEFVELAALLASNGQYEYGTIDEAVDLYGEFVHSIFSQWIAPDPWIELYFVPTAGQVQHVGGWYELAMDTHLIGSLNAGEVGFGPDTWLVLQFFDEDVLLNDRVGDIHINRSMARTFAGCGPVSIILSPSEMVELDTRIQAVELEIESLP